MRNRCGARKVQGKEGTPVLAVHGAASSPVLSWKGQDRLTVQENGGQEIRRRPCPFRKPGVSGSSRWATVPEETYLAIEVPYRGPKGGLQTEMGNTLQGASGPNKEGQDGVSARDTRA